MAIGFSRQRNVICSIRKDDPPRVFYRKALSPSARAPMLTRLRWISVGKSLLLKRYCTAITRDSERVFDLVGQDKYLKGRVRALKGLLSSCSGDRQKLASALLVFAKYDVIAVAKLILSLLVALGISIPTDQVIDYRDESLNSRHLIPEANRGNPEYLAPNYRPLLYHLLEVSDQGQNLDDFTSLPFPVHPREIVMDPPKRHLGRVVWSRPAAAGSSHARTFRGGGGNNT